MQTFGPNLKLLINANRGEEHYDNLTRLLRGLDGLVQPIAMTMNLLAPPGSPMDGDTHIVGVGAAGDWAGKDKHIARRYTVGDGSPAWEFFQPNPGWAFRVLSELDANGVPMVAVYSDDGEWELESVSGGVSASQFSTTAPFLSWDNHEGKVRLDFSMESLKENLLVGEPEGLATLGEDGKVPADQLPSYVDDVVEFDDYDALPETGEGGKIYITLDDGKQYRWSGSTYVEIVASPGTTDNVPEGTTNLYHTDARVRSTALTGFSAAGSSFDVVATDSVLQAFQKIQGRLNTLGTSSTMNVVTSQTDTTTGRLGNVGYRGIGKHLDLRDTIYSTGTPDDLYGTGFTTGIADGEELGIPGLEESSFGVLTVNAQWNSSAGEGAVIREFSYGTRRFVQEQSDSSTWGDWVEDYNTGSVSSAISSFMGLSSPGAVRFLRFNADNTASLLSDSDMRTALSLVPQSDGYDTTSGRIARNDLMGLGLGVTNVTAYTGDMLSFTYTHFLRIGSTASNLPVSDNGYALFIHRSSSNMKVIFWPDSGGEYSNTMKASVWGGWKEVIDTGNTSTFIQNLLFTENPDATRYIRINSDNTISVLSAADFVSAIGLAEMAITATAGTLVRREPGTGDVYARLLRTSGTHNAGTVSHFFVSLDSTPDALGRMAKEDLFTTLGWNMTQLANVSAIRFLRINADNTISTLSASDFLTAIGAGTAAVANVTTSQTDQTAARLLKLFDFGIGANDTVNPPTVGDADTLQGSGIYRVSGASTNVNGVGSGLLIHGNIQTGRAAQLLISTAGVLYYRSSNSFAGTAWKTVWDNTNLVKTTSSTDTTEGSVPLIRASGGIYGLGGSAPSANLDMVQRGGIYLSDGNSSESALNATGMVMLNASRNPGVGWQIGCSVAGPVGSNGLVNFYGRRTSGNGTDWGQLVTFYTTGNTSANVQTMLGSANNAAIRTNIGATTVGANLFTLTNPSAVRYLRINANNTVTALSADDLIDELDLFTDSNIGSKWSVIGNNFSLPNFAADDYRVAVNRAMVIRTLDADEGLDASDNLVTYLNSTGNNATLTIPNDSTVTTYSGFRVRIINNGGGTLTIARGSGVALCTSGTATNANRSIGAYGNAWLEKIGENTWYISGTGVS